jgi:hypothetical protein
MRHHDHDLSPVKTLCDTRARTHKDTQTQTLTRTQTQTQTHTQTQTQTLTQTQTRTSRARAHTHTARSLARATFARAAPSRWREAQREESGWRRPARLGER